jgi:hypothetical protein
MVVEVDVDSDPGMELDEVGEAVADQVGTIKKSHDLGSLI